MEVRKEIRTVEGGLRGDIEKILTDMQVKYRLSNLDFVLADGDKIEVSCNRRALLVTLQGVLHTVQLPEPITYTLIPALLWFGRAPTKDIFV